MKNLFRKFVSKLVDLIGDTYFYPKTLIGTINIPDLKLNEKIEITENIEQHKISEGLMLVCIGLHNKLEKGQYFQSEFISITNRDEDIGSYRIRVEKL